ncbi:MAG: sensor histidine kinase, partial [Pseudonocardiaceae bacterium]
MPQELVDQAATRPDVVRRWVPLAAFAVVLVAELCDPAPWGEGVALIAAGAMLVVWERRWLPSPVVAAGVLVGVGLSQLSGRLEPGLFLVSLLAIVVAGWERSAWRAGLVCAAAVAAPAVIVALQPAGNRIAWGLWVMGVAFPAVLGRGMYRQQRLIAELESARGQLARQAQAEERRRIARDVHDLVGHGLAAVLVQVSSARHVLRRDVQATEEALVAAEEVGRRSMRELRRTMTMLRAAEDGAVDMPVPELVGLGALVDSARRDGLAVEY